MTATARSATSQGTSLPNRAAELGDLFNPQVCNPDSFDALRKNLQALIGPFVPPVWRDAEGVYLDLDKLPSLDFPRFVNFLASQAALNDHMVGTPYKDLLLQLQYRPLLKVLYTGESSHSLSDLNVFYRSLQRELIKLDAASFTQKYFSTQSGRKRLFSILGSSDYSFVYSDVYSELAKGIAEAGKRTVTEHEVGLVEGEYSFFYGFQIYTRDIFGWNPQADNQEHAVKAAQQILVSAGRVYGVGESYSTDYGEKPDDVVAQSEKLDHVFVSERQVNGAYLLEITSEEIKAKSALAQEKLKKGDVVSQLEGQLANLWLFYADGRNWGRMSEALDRNTLYRMI